MVEDNKKKVLRFIKYYWKIIINCCIIKKRNGNKCDFVTKKAKNKIYCRKRTKGENIMKELNMNLELYEKSVNESEKPVLVEFWAPWCVYCRRIAPAYDKIAEQYADKLVVGKINVDDVPEAAKKEKIEAIPALLLYKGGEVVDSIVAPDSKARIEEFIEKNL